MTSACPPAGAAVNCEPMGAFMVQLVAQLAQTATRFVSSTQPQDGRQVFSVFMWFIIGMAMFIVILGLLAGAAGSRRKRKLPTETPAPPAQPHAECPHCGWQVHRAAKFCANCGQRLA